MREASADLANLLDDDDPNGDAPANQSDARDQPREADDSPTGAAATSNPYRRASRSHSTSPARAADGQHSHGNQQPYDANGGPQAAAAAHDDEPVPEAVVKQETMDNANQSPKHAEGGSSRHRKEKKSSKDKHKSSHKSKKERHKDKHRDEDRAGKADGCG